MSAPRIAIPDAGAWVAARAVAATLREHGFAAWFVGGCVRDCLLQRPVSDVDLATDAVPERVCELFPRTVTVGKSFGVVIVVASDGSHCEVATFRADGRYLDHRRPEAVRFGSVEEDVRRRDFTINALLLDPWSGELRDLVGGMEDLKARVLRCVGDPASRLREDPLRVLRALRFAATLECAIEPATWAALTTTSLQGVSPERILQEWEKATRAPPARFLELLIASSRLSEVCPPLAQLPSEGQARVLQAQRALPARVDFAMVLASCLARVSVAVATSWLSALPLERQRQRQVTWLLTQLRQLPGLDALSRPDRRRLARHGDAGHLVLLATAMGAPQAPQLTQAVAEERSSPELRVLLDGDALQALGIPAGPQLGQLLRHLEDLQLDGRISERTQAVAAVRAWLAGRA